MAFKTALFAALFLLCSAGALVVPELAQRTLAVLLGPTSYNGVALEDMVRQHGLEQLVRVMARVPHPEAMALLKGADVALLFGQSGEESLASIPAKVYEYVGMSKAVLAIGVGEEACGVLRRGGCPVWQAPADDVQAICASLVDIAGHHERGDLTSLSCPAARELFTQRYMAIQLERTLLEAMGRPGGPEALLGRTRQAPTVQYIPPCAPRATRSEVAWH